MLKKFLPTLLLSLLLAGCAAQFTNLTPQQQLRHPDNFYSVSMAFTSRQQSLRWDSIQASVVVDTNFYPMRLTPMMNNRWETLVPVPPGTNVVHYRYRLDFKYNAMPDHQNDNLWSPDYTLQILDK